jgi:RHS repeat-associated protein
MYFKILNDGSAMVTTGRQTTTDAYTFEAFGNPTGQSGTTVNPFRYVGALGYYWFDFAHHGRDRTSGLRLLGARYYGPSPRRFWTSDPASAGLNRYSYVGNAPTARVDPRGLWCWHLPLNICIGTTCKHDPGCPAHLPPKTPSFPGTSLCAAPRPSCPTIGPYKPGAPGTWMSPHTWQDCAKGHMIFQCQLLTFGASSMGQDCRGCCDKFPTDYLACFNSCNTLSQFPDMEGGGLGPGYG